MRINVIIAAVLQPIFMVHSRRNAWSGHRCCFVSSFQRRTLRWDQPGSLHLEPERERSSTSQRISLGEVENDNSEIAVSTSKIPGAAPITSKDEECNQFYMSNADNAPDNKNDDTVSLNSLLNKIKSYCPTADTDLISKAYSFSEKAHMGQRRKSGEPYFIHPVGVTHIIADMKLDVSSIVTGLLHDTVEDCADVNLDRIKDEFGEEIANLVDGVTKIGKIQFRSRQERQAENYRKMIIAMARDIRVILVKLADRTHNIRTLEHMPSHKQKEVAQETLELYAPLAHRLGIYRIKTELEDTSLKYLLPEVYEKLEVMVNSKLERQQAYTDSVVDTLKEHMHEAGGFGNQSIAVTGRAKSYNSIYRKMQSKHLDFDDIEDLIAFRVLVGDVGQCYQALGIVHAHFKPCQGRFKDYIALPKPNGYQSLHTTVIGPKGKRMEVQIRTHEMHRVAEEGIAAHWIYKGESKGVEEARRFTWLRQLVNWVQQLNDPEEFMHSVKEDLFEKEVFVFSPTGQLFALSRGSSVLDFAYCVHSDLGNRCIGAKVNGKIVPLKYKVSNGDTIEIRQSANQTPHREWLDMVQTSKARTRIRSWLKQRQRDESIAIGQELLDKEMKRIAKRFSHVDANKEYKEKLGIILSIFKLRDEQHLFTALGYGQISASSCVKEIFALPGNQNKGLTGDEKDDEILHKINDKQSNEASANDTDGVIVGGERNVLISFCKNCCPLHGEEVKGVITRGHGIKVHRLGCTYLLESDEERRVNVMWDENAVTRRRPVKIDVEVEDIPGMLANASRAISSSGTNIASAVLVTLSNGRGLARFEVLIQTVEDLNAVMRQLQKEKGVLNVVRR